MESGGVHQIFLADHEADGIGAAHVLEAEADRIGAAGSDVLHALDGIDLECSIYDDGDVSGVGDGYDFREG